MSRWERGSIAVERKLRRWAGGPGLVGYAVVAALVGVALLLYFVRAHINPHNGGPIGMRESWTVVGETTGIVSAVLLAVVVILASRLAILQLLFGDLTKVYIAHGVLGILMFGLVSFHPIMYLLGGVVKGSGFHTAAHVLVPFHVVALEWGSYILIAVAMIPTLYMRLSFDWWRTSHLLLGAAMIMNGYAILIENQMIDTSQVPALRIYLFVLFGLGTLAFIWVAIVRRIAEPKREYRIIRIERHPAANAIEICAEPVGRPARFHAGQFAYVDLVDSMAHVHRDFEAHPYSIASHPGKNEISLVVEAAGRHTQRIHGIGEQHESRALIHGPFGRLVMSRPERRKQLWISGGIGVTPFIAMAEDMAEHPDQYQDYDVILIVCWTHRDQAFKAPALEAWASAAPGLRYHRWISDDRGRATIQGIAEEFVPDLRERALMISGPDAMISDLTRQALAAGVPRGQIRSEVAIGPPGKWELASPALRYTRVAATVWFAAFLAAVGVSWIGRAVGA
jgi:predicted ferric reductase